MKKLGDENDVDGEREGSIDEEGIELVSPSVSHSLLGNLIHGQPESTEMYLAKNRKRKSSFSINSPTKLKRDSEKKEVKDINFMIGLISPTYKQTLFYVLCPTIIVPLMIFWSVKLRKYFLYDEVDIKSASYLYCEGEDGELFIEPVRFVVRNGSPAKMAVIRCKKYFLLDLRGDSCIYSPVDEVPEKFTKTYLQSDFKDGSKKEEIKFKVGKRQEYKETYGVNEIRTPLNSFITLFIIESSDPFYCFQYFSVILWLFEQYNYYALVILVITMGSILFNVAQIHSNKKRMHEMAKISVDQDMLLESSMADFNLGSVHDLDELIPFKSSPANELVPGDYILVRSGQTMTCDAVLIHGECIVDENILTGETMPVRKTPFEQSMVASGVEYNPTIHCSQTLYCGTSVKLSTGILTSSSETSKKNGAAVAIVVRTGFLSAKGQLIRSILFPKHHNLQYTRDALYFILLMATLGLCFYLWTTSILIGYKASTFQIMFKFLDMMTIAVPPALACSLTISTAVAVQRLNKMQVFVTDSERVNWAGLINACCFDKTGTLTESGLNFHGIVPKIEKKSTDDISTFSDESFEMLATCHGLSLLDDNLVGDPLEIRLFETSGCTLKVESSSKGPVTIISCRSGGKSRRSRDVSWKIERRFDFASEKMRSGVVISRLATKDSEMVRVFHVKGSPEAIQKIVLKDTLPPNYQELMNSFTRQGLRVLAFAFRKIKDDEDIFSCADQSVLETDMIYGGLILLANTLKSDSKQTITDLLNANIKVCMITGDHLRTAVAVSYKCGILENSMDTIIIDVSEAENSNNNQSSSDINNLPLSAILTSVSASDDSIISMKEAMELVHTNTHTLAITGRALHVLLDANKIVLFAYIVGKCRVFARMEPEDKALVVDTLGSGVSQSYIGQHIEKVTKYFVAFCGDGANDIAALKSSMVGVSLCDAEASVAAPFTSKPQTPSIMVKILIEGRCSLVASFSLFKFIMAYAFIQVLGTTLLYNLGIIQGNWQYFIQDMILTTIMAISISYTEPMSILPAERPESRFLTLSMILPVIAYFIVTGIFQKVSLVWLGKQSWYVPYVFDPVAGPLLDTNEWETNAVFTMCLAQYIIAALVLDTGAPFRKAWYTNYFKVFCVLYQSAIVLVLILIPQKFDWHCWQSGIFAADPPRNSWLISGQAIQNMIDQPNAYGGSLLPMMLNNTPVDMYSDNLIIASTVFDNCKEAIKTYCSQTIDNNSIIFGFPNLNTLKCLYEGSIKDYFLNYFLQVRTFPSNYDGAQVFIVILNIFFAFLIDYFVKILLKFGKRESLLKISKSNTQLLDKIEGETFISV